MSYRIEITADTLAELAGKAASLAAKLNGEPVLQGAAEAAPADPTPTPPAPVAEESASLNTEETSTLAPVAEASASDAPTLDYKTEVAPLVLKLVEVCGKPAAQRVLDQFGAAKASDIPTERWPELVGIIKAEMGQ